VANCAWWIAAVTGLDSELSIHIDNLWSRHSKLPQKDQLERGNNYRAILKMPRDIARGVSPEDKSSDYIPDQLRGTRKGRINPLSKTKRQLKKARQAKKREKARNLNPQV
jgi:hypothetical protein